MSEPASPEECARLCLEGDPQAFGALYDRLAPEVQRFLLGLRLGLSREEVEDAVQESFLRLYRRLGQLDPSRPLRPYLLGVARHAAIDRWRRRQTRAAREEAVALAAAADAAPADQLAEEAEARASVQEALEALEPELRSVLVLRHLGELTMADLACALECSVPTARARLREAAARMAAELRRRGLTPGEVSA